MSGALREQLALLPGYLGGHVLLTVVALSAGIALSLPLAFLALRRPRLRDATLALASVVQTIPGLALLALMVPVLAGIGDLSSRWFGIAPSVLGFLPAVTALTLYSMLPVLRNTVAGIDGIDADIVEAARGMGMTPGAILRRVQIPLAAPVILAGIRTAAVWTVGAATLATPVGQVCLGNYIFSGLQTRNWTAVLTGCVAAALLAICLDALLALVERGVALRRPPLAWGAAAGLALLLAGGLLLPRLALPSRVAGSPGEDAREPVRVAAKTFTEQYILAALLEGLLREQGFPVERVDGLGSTVIFDALVEGEVDVYVDYSGTIWANHMQRSGVQDRGRVLGEMTDWLDREHHIRCLGPLGFENAYALAMRREHAAELGLTEIGDLAPLAPEMVIGGDYEFFGRPEWRDLREEYGLRFRQQVSYDSTFMYHAVAHAEVDVISAFSSDGRIAAYDLEILADARGIIPPYDAVLLLSPAARRRPALVKALRPLVGAIDVRTMREANHRVDRDEERQTVEETARWLGQTVGLF